MTGWARACWWGLSVIGIVTAAGLVVWVSVGHPEGADQGWGIAGAIAGIAALGIGLWQLRLTAGAAAATPASAPVAVTAQGGSVAAGGSVRNARARDTGPGTGTGAATGGPGISASGGSVAAGGDVDGSEAHQGP
ncbi:hypothetical protein [Streptomyces sp. NPDC058401]|uniref:hypothetical protein n=1 Tax=Streptomyces sp. NPDC058401 TaxID=3346480 RepID=UPI0036460579